MEPDIKAMARQIDELGGTLAAVLAVVAAMPGLDKTLIASARELLVLPPAVDNFSLPMAAASRALDRIQAVADQLVRARQTPKADARSPLETTALLHPRRKNFSWLPPIFKIPLFMTMTKPAKP